MNAWPPTAGGAAQPSRTGTWKSKPIGLRAMRVAPVSAMWHCWQVRDVSPRPFSSVNSLLPPPRDRGRSAGLAVAPVEVGRLCPQRRAVVVGEQRVARRAQRRLADLHALRRRVAHEV